MATVNQVRDRLLDKLATMDIDRMTLMDAGQYANMLKTLSEINERSYVDMLMETMRNGFGCNSGYVPVRLGDSVGGADDVQ